MRVGVLPISTQIFADKQICVIHYHIVSDKKVFIYSTLPNQKNGTVYHVALIHLWNKRSVFREKSVSRSIIEMCIEIFIS